MRLPTENEKDLYQSATGQSAPWCFMMQSPYIPGGKSGWAIFPPLILHRKGVRADLIIHEMVHVRQCYDGWWLIFGIKYLVEHIRNGYQKNAFEVEARAAQNKVLKAEATR